MPEMFPDFPELVFEESYHRYKLNGMIIPSVTTLMKPLSNSLYNTVDPEILNKAAERGTSVHNAIENYIKFGIADIPEKRKGYFEAFKSWWQDYKPEPLGSECKLYHKILMYAGTADFPCIIDGKAVLIDFKTSSSINKMLTGVQLEAYAKAAESHGYVFDEKAILHLQANGNYDYLTYKKNDFESWECFGALLTINNHIKKFK